MDSILKTIKALLGADPDDTHFDKVLLTHINRAFDDLRQIGVNPVTDLPVTTELDNWKSKFGNAKNINSIITYVYFKVRLAFDPPQNSTMTALLEKQLAEVEWRLTNPTD